MSYRRTTSPRSRLMVAAVFALMLVACGSNTSSTSPHTTATKAAVPSSPHRTSSSHAAAKAVASTFTEFFAGTTPADRKVTLVQDGQGFAPVINAQAGGAMSQGTTAKVSRVTFTSASGANVLYTIFLSGTPVLKNQVGVAVKEKGRWVVGAATFCQLLTLEQSAPPLCKKVS